MDIFVFSDGAFAVLLATAYGILLYPVIVSAWRDTEAGERCLLEIGCAIAGALLLARLQDILSILVRHHYGILSADVVIGLLLNMSAVFWQMIIHRLLPRMGTALGHILHMPFDFVLCPDPAGRVSAVTSILLTARAFVVLGAGLTVLYLWFAIPSVLVGLGRSLDSETEILARTGAQQEMTARSEMEQVAMQVFSDYNELRNHLKERTPQSGCREQCKLSILNQQSALANTLLNYQIRNPSPSAFKTALLDPATATALQNDLRRIGNAAGLSWKKAGLISRFHLTIPSAPDLVALQEQTDRRIVNTLTRAVTSPGLERLAPALRDPVLLLAFLVELCVLAALLFSNTRPAKS